MSLTSVNRSLTLPQAILLGTTFTEQMFRGFGGVRQDGDKAVPVTCVFGAALSAAHDLAETAEAQPQAFGTSYTAVTSIEGHGALWPEANDVRVTCPCCKYVKVDTLGGTIIHLNDHHRADRRAVALWCQDILDQYSLATGSKETVYVLDVEDEDDVPDDVVFSVTLPEDSEFTAVPVALDCPVPLSELFSVPGRLAQMKDMAEGLRSLGRSNMADQLEVMQSKVATAFQTTQTSTEAEDPRAEYQRYLKDRGLA